MRTAQELSPFDRGTLVVWKIGNVVGWSLVALAAGLLVQILVLNVAFLFDKWWNVSIGQEANLGSLVLAGAVIGSVIGRRVFRSVGPIAGGLAALHGLVLLGPTYWGLSGALAPAIGSEVVVAILFALRGWRVRPLALRGGRLPR
jgi:hypothetical protein